MADNPYINKVEYGGETLIDLTGDTVTPQTLLEGATAHDKSGASITGAVAVAPPSTTTPKMDGTASVGTETAFARGDHIHPTDTSLVSKTGDNECFGRYIFLGGVAISSDLFGPMPEPAEGALKLCLPTYSTENDGGGVYLWDAYDSMEAGRMFISKLNPSMPYIVLRTDNGYGLRLCSATDLIDMCNARLIRVEPPVNNSDAANKAYVDARTPDVQTQGNWRYKVYADGTFEAWYKATGQSLVITSQSGNLFRSDLQTITVPTNMTSGKTCNILHVSVNAAHNNYPTWGMLASIQTPTANTFKYYAMSGGSRSASPNYTVTAYVFGTLE